eukprot:SAG22_NODE_330_length_12211_cov_6.451948_7_plen_104_part_00
MRRMSSGWSGAQVVYWNCESRADLTWRPARIKVEAAPGTISWSIGNVGAGDAGGAGANGAARGQSEWEHYGPTCAAAQLVPGAESCGPRSDRWAGAGAGVGAG